MKWLVVSMTVAITTSITIAQRYGWSGGSIANGGGSGYSFVGNCRGSGNGFVGNSRSSIGDSRGGIRDGGSIGDGRGSIGYSWSGIRNGWSGGNNWCSGYLNSGSSIRDGWGGSGHSNCFNGSWLIYDLKRGRENRLLRGYCLEDVGIVRNEGKID